MNKPNLPAVRPPVTFAKPPVTPSTPNPQETNEMTPEALETAQALTESINSISQALVDLCYLQGVVARGFAKGPEAAKVEELIKAYTPA